MFYKISTEPMKFSKISKQYICALLLGSTALATSMSMSIIPANAESGVILSQFTPADEAAVCSRTNAPTSEMSTIG